MTDLVAQLVALIEEAPHYFDPQHDFDGKKAEWFNLQRAALSEAKAGGWVAVPVEPTPEMVEAARDVKRQRLARAVAELKQGKRPDTIGMALSVNEEWAAMLAARPLPAPPAQRGEG